MQESRFLKELDLSWCRCDHSSLVKFINTLRDNRQLTHLNLSWNVILELGSSERSKQTEQSNEMTAANLAIMDCFKQFIKYNPKLVELDLSNTKLTNTAIIYLCYCLRRASSLKTLHLCGNVSRHGADVIRELSDD